jgi:beta-ring hydroxylase
MPEARGDIREIVGQPVFVPLYNLYLRYGKLFRLRCVYCLLGFAWS